MPVRIRSHVDYKAFASTARPVVQAQPLAQPQPRSRNKAVYGVWSDEKIALLKALWGRAKYLDIIQMTGMSQGAVYTQANKLGLPLRTTCPKKFSAPPLSTLST